MNNPDNGDLYVEQAESPSGEDSHAHAHRKSVLARLARIEGHVRAVRRMVEADVSCPDVLIQIAAVRSALNAAGRLILEDHVRGCLVDAAQKGEFEEVFDDLKNSLDKFIG
jgi:DNA-binding FrmR family transcriptional regulator